MAELQFNATIEDDLGHVFYLTARSDEELQKLIACHLITLGVMSGKGLEVLADGAKWIASWVAGIKGIAVSKILCWWHLCKRVYEALSGLGWEKKKKKAMEREILGMLWRGDVTQTVWTLWGLRSEAKTPTRINELMGYLLRKREWIVDYSQRKEQGLWIASTRVEKWNDLSVSDRCKHRGMSWTLPCVMSKALYASEKRTPKLDLNSAG